MATNNIWLDDTKSNRFIQTYLQGYLDMSGGDLRLRNQNIFVNDGDISLNGILSVASDTSLNSQLFVANDVSMDTILMVGGDVSLNSKLFVANDVSMDTVLMVGGDVSLNSKLFVANDVSMDTILMVGGDVSLNSKLFVANDVSMDTVLMVGSDASLNSKLFVANDASMNAILSVGSNLMVGGDASLNGKVFIANDVSMDTVLMVGSDVSMNSKLFVANDVSMDTILSVGRKLMVGGDASLNSKLFVANDVSMDTILMVGGDASLNSKLFVVNDVSMNSILSVGSNIMAGGDVSLNSKLFVVEDVSMNSILSVGSNIMVGSDASLNGKLFVGNDVSMDTILTVGSDVSLNGKLFVANDVSMDTILTVGSDVSLNGKLFVANDVSMDTILTVGSDVSLNGKLYVVDDVSMNAILSVGSNLMIGGDASLNGKLFVVEDVSMNTILSVGSNLMIGGDASLNGKLFVENDVSLNGNLSLGGDFIPANIVTGGYAKIGRTLDVSNDVVFGSTLDVSGSTTIRSSLHVIGDVSMDTGIIVGGDASFNSMMTVSGDVSFHKNLSVQNNLNIVDGTVTNKQIITISNLPYYSLGPTPSFTNDEIDIYSDFSGNLSILNGRYDILASSILTDNGITYNPSNVFDGHNNTYWASSDNQYDESTYTGSINTEITEINGNATTISGEYIEVTLPFHIRLREVSVGCINNRDTNQSNNDNIKIHGLSIVAENNNIWYQVYSSNIDDLGIHDVSSIAIDTDIYANKFRYIITKITDQVFKNAIVSDLSFSGDVIGSTIHMNNGSIGIGADDPRSALEVVGDVTISKVHSGKNTSDTDVEHGRISWCGKDNHKTGSYIRSYFEKDTLDTSGNLAFGTSDGSNDAVDRFILHSDGVSNFISDVSMDANLAVNGDVSMNSELSIGDVARFNDKVVIGKNTVDRESDYILDVSGSIRTTNISITKDISTTGTVGSGKLELNDGTNTNIDYPIIQPSNDKEGIDFVTGDSINFHISKSGDISMNSNLVVTGDISLNSKLFVNGDVSFNSNLFVKETAILGSDASMNAGLTVAEDVSLNSNLNVVGNSQLTTVTASGDISANTHLRIGNTLQVNGDASFNQHVEISGNLVVNGFLDAQSFQNINTKNTTVENYTLIFSEDISLNGRIDVSGGANINNRFIVDPEAGVVNVIDQNITIGKEIYLDKLISEAVFSESNVTTNAAGETISEAASESEKIVSFSNATYKIQASSVNTGSSGNNPRRALNNNDKSWKTMTRQYDINGAYTGSQNTKYKDIGDTPTVSNISGEWIQITFPYETVIDSFQLHTSEFQLPKHGFLLAYTGNGTETDVSWTLLAEYNPNRNDANQNDMVNTDMSSNQIPTRVIRLVIDNISTSNRSTENYYSNNLAIRFLNFSGTYKDTGILYGSGNSQSAGNTGIGFSTLTGNVTGKNNIAIGGYSLAQTTDSNNVGVGYNSLELTTTGGENVGMGTDALSDNTIGSGNTALGYFSGINNVDGSFNSFIGYNSGTNGNNPYSYSTALGQNATITDNHQIVLGTVDDTISIPGDVSYISVNNVDVSYIHVTTMTVQDGTINTLIVPPNQDPPQLRSGLIVSNTTTNINAGLIIGTASTTTIKNTLNVTGDVLMNDITIHGSARISDISAQDMIVSDFSSIGSNNLKSGVDQILRLTQGSHANYTNNSYIDFDNGDDIQIKANIGLELIAVDNISIVIGNATRLEIDNAGQITLRPAAGKTVEINGPLRTTGGISTPSLSVASGDATTKSTSAFSEVVIGSDVSNGPSLYSGITDEDETKNEANIIYFGKMDGDPDDPEPITDYYALSIDSRLIGPNSTPIGTVTAGFDMVVNQDLSNNRTIYGKSLVMDSSSILHDLKVTNDTSLNNLYVTNDVLFNSNLDVSGTTTLNSLDVSGTTTLNLLDVSGATTLNSLDVSGSSLFQNGTFEINDNSFNHTNIPLSITGDFTGNTKVIYSQYHGSDRVFNGMYDVSASSKPGDAWKVFNGATDSFWQSESGITGDDVYSSGDYIGTLDISHVTHYYADDINELTGISGEYIEFNFPFSLKVTDISFGTITNSSNTIGTAKLVGEVNNQWKHILDVDIQVNTGTNSAIEANVSDISYAFTQKLRLVVLKTRSVGDSFPTTVKITELSFSGDVIGSKFHISEGNVGIGTVTPRSALDVDGDIILSKAHSGLNETGDLIEHGRISWLGRQGTTDKTSSYIRSYYKNDTYDTCGNLAFGTSDGNNNATDHIILHSSGKTSFTSDMSVNGLTIGTGSGDITTNTVIGYQALYSNTSGYYNTAIGYQSLFTNEQAIRCVAVGYQALYHNTGNFNVANGYQSLFANTTGQNNTAIGDGSLKNNTTGNDNTANGADALLNNETGTKNTAIGTRALYANTTGTYNVAIGADALNKNTTGTSNVAVGLQALLNNDTGSYNVANGLNALSNNDTGSSNVATGYQALYDNSSGNYNVANGTSALHNNATGSSNVATGYKSLFSNETGISNVAAGYQALYNNTGNFNVANGYQALYNNTDGSYNVATGYQSLFLNQTGISNVATGYQALYKNTGTFNVANGTFALFNNTEGSSNVAIGTNSGLNNTNGDYNTFLGTNTDVSNTTSNFSVSTALGYNAKITASNQIMLGTTNETVVVPNRLNVTGNVGIGTTNPLGPLHISKASGLVNCYFESGAGFTSTQAERVSLILKNQNFEMASIVAIDERTVYNGTYLGGLAFKTHYNNVMSEQMRIDANGNVGIGTTNPTGKLHIYEATGTTEGPTTGSLVIEHGNPRGESSIVFPSKQNRGSDYGYIKYKDDIYNTSGQERAVLIIGTSNETNDNIILQPSGSVGIKGNPNNSYALDVNGAVDATSYNASSDYRIKENVIPISDTSYNIDNIRPVTYTNTKMEKQDFGVIAHELQEQIPFLVTGEKDGEHHQSVNYNGLIGLLINEVQQLKKRVQELEQSKP